MLLAYGCPLQAIVKAFDLDERTVCEWQKRAGLHCQQVHEHLVEGPLLLAVDGLASYVSAFRNAFRSKFPRERGETGRCKMVEWPNIAIVQVVKQRIEGVLNVDRRIVQGAQAGVVNLIHATQQGRGGINTAFIERINATFRQRIYFLTRRTHCLCNKRILCRRACTWLAVSITSGIITIAYA